MTSVRQVGPYTIEAEIGRGGMGVVYRGRDTRLERAVAIKVLPPDVLGDEGCMARFDREARLLAGLSHPNIATVYGLEQDPSGRYLVMELVEGESLVTRLARGRLPVEQALSVAAQIAAGVEAAHERGIIHRDLKPGNVMVAPDGAVKVLDFGVARESATPRATGTTPTQAATKPLGVTREGIVVGTPGYMSPEQARGMEVDRRTDVFALGCILFECLSGIAPFYGRTQADAIAATLEREPEWPLLAERTPTRVRELLEQCLQKDAKRRLRDVGDARLELERAIERREWATTGMMRAAAPARRSWKRGVPWAIALIGLASAAAAAWMTLGRASAPAAPERRPTVRFVANAPHPWPERPDVGCVAISGDGQLLAYLDPEGLWVRRLSDAESGQRVVGSYAHNAGFSPDGRWLAFSWGQEIHRISVEGGQSERLFRGEGYIKGLCWGPSGIVLAPGLTHGLVLLNPDTREVTSLTTPDRAAGDVSHRWPDVLPDARHVLFTVKRAGIETFDEADIALLDTQSGECRVIIRGGTYARYAPTGHIVYARAGGLFAVSFDAHTGRVTSSPIEVLRGVATEPGSGAAQFALSRDAGTLMVAPGGPNTPGSRAVLLALDGTETPLSTPVRNYAFPVISPDGGRIAMVAFGATDTLFVHDRARQTTTRVTFEGNTSQPFWSRDGQRIGFVSDRDGAPALFQVAADGSGEVQRLGSGPSLRTTVSFVQFEGSEAILYPDRDGVWVLPPGGEPRRIMSTPRPVETATVSPDQRWIAYSMLDAQQGSSTNLYVSPFPGGESRWQISTGGGGPVNWFPNSDGLVYRDPAAGLVEARWGEQGPSAARSEESAVPPNADWFDILPDMSGVVVLRPVPPPDNPWRVEVILNWLDDLRERAPGGGG